MTPEEVNKAFETIPNDELVWIRYASHPENEFLILVEDSRPPHLLWVHVNKKKMEFYYETAIGGHVESILSLRASGIKKSEAKLTGIDQEAWDLLRTDPEFWPQSNRTDEVS